MKNSSEEFDLCRSSRFDIVLVGLILAVATGSILWVSRTHSRQSSGSATALVYQRDVLLKEIKLGKERTVTFPDNMEMEIEAKEGRIRIVKSDCPRKICMNTGWIRHSGQVIVCVPNSVLIEIKSSGSPFLDAVVY